MSPHMIVNLWKNFIVMIMLRLMMNEMAQIANAMQVRCPRSQHVKHPMAH